MQNHDPINPIVFLHKTKGVLFSGVKGKLKCLQHKFKISLQYNN